MRWDIRYRLHRRIIEIRDAQLVLRPYSVRVLVKLAAAMAWESDLSSGRVAAVAEAAIIVSALRFGMPGSIYRHDRVPGDRAGVPSGIDMRAEVVSLVLACRAIRHSRIVPRAAGRVPRPVARHEPRR